MAKARGPSHVYCYHCGHRIEVGGLTMSTACPACHKAVVTEDIVVKGYKPVVTIETCGRLIVPARGRVVVQKRIIAHAGIELHGKVQCPYALTTGHVSMGRKAEWKGDLRARSLTVEPGAKIFGGHFTVPDDPLAEFRSDGE